jgi:molybdenum cofactor biosynthesis enzyme
MVRRYQNLSELAKRMAINNVKLLEKHGGKSGSFVAGAAP